MKTQYYRILMSLAVAVWLGFALTGCRKDLGNYDYNPVDSLVIGNMQDTYQYTIGATMNISPELKFLHNSTFNESDYTYEWATYTSNTAAKKVIHQGKNLDIALPLGIGSYRGYYVVTQKSTGITWQKRFTLDVFGTFQPAGWFVLNDIDGKSRLDFYQENRDAWNTFPVIYRDLASLIKDVNTGSPLELTGKPLSVTAFQNRDGINSTMAYRLYINTDKATQWINITAGFTWDKLRNVFANETVSGEPASVSVIYPGVAGGAYAYKDQQLYLYHTTYSLYGTPVNRISGVPGTFPISPYIVAPANQNMHAVFYDTQNKRFLGSMASSVGATILNSSAQGLDLSNTGKDLVWMGYTPAFNGQVVALLKDGSRYYLARLTFPYTIPTTNINILVSSFEEITGRLTDLATADKFTMDHQFGYLFYVSGNKLYQYDMDSKMVKLAKDYGSRTISLLKVNTLTAFTTANVPNFPARFTSPGYGLIVGSYDAQNPAGSGTVDFYTATSLMGNLAVSTPPFTGLGKVVDVKYSEL